MENRLNANERAILLQIAEQSIRRAVLNQPPLDLDLITFSPSLQQIGASFVTLTIAGRLRGCIGTLQASQPLARDVAEHAIAAALHDHRFPPLTEEELSLIEIEISRLTNPIPLEYETPEELIEKLQPHIDGVVLSDGFQRATFLPQVWEKLPNPQDFLSQLCLKMGAPPDLWRRQQLDVFVYQVEEFRKSKPGILVNEYTEGAKKGDNQKRNSSSGRSINRIGDDKNTARHNPDQQTFAKNQPDAKMRKSTASFASDNLEDTQKVSLKKASHPPSLSRVPKSAHPPKPPKPPSEFLKSFFSRFDNFDWGCVLRLAVISIFVGIIISILALSFLVIQYFVIASGLPSVEDLRAKASQFETTRIFDRDGNLIYEIIDPNAGRRTYVSLNEISPYLIAATIATEDKDFYNNPGFDPWGIMRAFWQNYTSGEIVSGASTITQQLARTLLLSPEERAEQSVQRKTREIVLAAEITRKYSKEEILELYLNEIYYGNLAYGIQAASETYFNISADLLTLGQASFLAGLPQAPAVYDIFSNRNAALLRHQDVLNLIYLLSSAEDCIKVSNSTVPVCVSLNEAVTAAQEMEEYPFEKKLITMPFPHWVNFIRVLLEEQYDPQTIYRSGFRVYTTLDPDLQRYAQNAVREQVDKLVANNASNGALVAIRPQTGEILAMVGSADFNNEAISGQVNMSVAPRQPGSSIKPLTYTAAFEKGWTPATLIWDVESEFPPSGDPNDTREPYKPVNYDRKFHGPVRVRTALGSSYNVPAVKTLDFVGIYDDPTTPQEDGFIAFAKRMGITTLTRQDYGLSLTLGGGDVSLLELTGAYGIFANEGKLANAYAIMRIEDHTGKVVYEPDFPDAEQVIRAEHAYLISSILSDNQARTPAFGANSILRLPFQAAVKTGTTNDFRDNWTLGYTPDIAIGVWIGNADYTPMQNTTGLSGAAPIWSDVMQYAIQRYTGNSPTSFRQPSTVLDEVVCSVSGAKPSEKCPSQIREVFAQDQPPLPKEEDLWKLVTIDTWTNHKASPACAEFTKQEWTLNVSEKWALKWIKETAAGRDWAEGLGFSDPVLFTPERECKADDPRPTIVFVGITDGMAVKENLLDIYAVITATKNYKQFNLEYGLGDNPSQWTTLLSGVQQQFTQPARIYTLDLYTIPSDIFTLRVYLKSDDGGYAEKKIHLRSFLPTLTPTITPVPTETPTPTPILDIPPTATETAFITSTPETP